MSGRSNGPPPRGPGDIPHTQTPAASWTARRACPDRRCRPRRARTRARCSAAATHAACAKRPHGAGVQLYTFITVRRGKHAGAAARTCAGLKHGAVAGCYRARGLNMQSRRRAASTRRGGLLPPAAARGRVSARLALVGRAGVRARAWPGPGSVAVCRPVLGRRSVAGRVCVTRRHRRARVRGLSVGARRVGRLRVARRRVRRRRGWRGGGGGVRLRVARRRAGRVCCGRGGGVVCCRRVARVGRRGRGVRVRGRRAHVRPWGVAKVRGRPRESPEHDGGLRAVGKHWLRVEQ